MIAYSDQPAWTDHALSEVILLNCILLWYLWLLFYASNHWNDYAQLICSDRFMKLTILAMKTLKVAGLWYITVIKRHLTSDPTPSTIYDSPWVYIYMYPRQSVLRYYTHPCIALRAFTMNNRVHVEKDNPGLPAAMRNQNLVAWRKFVLDVAVHESRRLQKRRPGPKLLWPGRSTRHDVMGTEADARFVFHAARTGTLRRCSLPNYTMTVSW
jgi:hypothetical protein